jgi:cytochrome oxidase Cu insertion factor (SCO1/SenC/PrrC family)
MSLPSRPGQRGDPPSGPGTRAPLFADGPPPSPDREETRVEPGLSPDQAGPAPAPPGHQLRRRLAALGIGVVLAALLAGILFGVVGRGGSPSTTEAAPGIDAASAYLFNLDVLPPSAVHPAPGFDLTDQFGKPLSLAQFRGTSVVLSFNDDRCTDICTMLAQDVVRADRYLGPTGRRLVQFVSVNANPFYPEVAYVRQWSDEHGLGHLSNWHFATGPVATLESVWKTYGETVTVDYASRTITHATPLEFIDPSGRVRAIGEFGTSAIDTAPFAHGIAQMADDLLPAAERRPVGGPQADASATQGANLGQQAPGFRLPELGRPKSDLALARFRGRPVVVNFWSSNCPDCKAELPALSSVAGQYSRSIAFVGVDVADPSPRAAEALVRAARVAYPVVVDRSGATSSSYRLPGLPYTVVVAPDGTIAVRHPGALSAEQLRYVLENAYPGLTGNGSGPGQGP